MNNFKKVLVQAAKKAGAFQLKNFGNIKHRDVKRKLHGEYVTYVDTYSCKLIVEVIKKYYPSHNIISEELPAVQKGSDYTWYIDPLDGTTNYSINNPLFGVAIAVAKKKEVIESVVYLPVLKQLYYAKRTAGTYVNGKRVHVSTTGNIHKSIITLSFPHNLAAARKAMSIFKKIRPDVANIRIFGSGYYAFCSVAAGCVEALVIQGDIHPWDSFAGTLLVEEAGGMVTNFRGKQNVYHKNLLISNRKVHQQILKKLG